MFEHDETVPTIPKVLFVDDTEDNLDLLEFALKKKPISMFRASSGKECLVVAEEQQPDMIVLDIQMPEMDGFETLRRLRANPATSRIPVIFLTAIKRDPQSIAEGILLGAEEYLTKPIDLEELFARVRSIYRVMAVQRELEQVKSQFMAMLVHDLRTPLTIVISSIDYILRHYTNGKQLDSDSVKLMETVLASTRGMANLVNDLLDLSKYQAGQMLLNKQTITIHEMIEESLQPFLLQFKRKNIELKTDVNPELPRVDADSGKIVQLMTNLLSNAMKFTPDNGIVSIRVEKEHSAEANADFIKVSVSDSGVGIKPEEIPLLFEQYRQVSSSTKSKEKGTGLGLAICKLIVQAHSGTISVVSELNVGTTFIFTLPAQNEA
ncbi:MAG: hybrid sensor histidine kinase/response regulator [Bacteriovoracaceae bacterium]|nr:hybrid sensor histidine kinase/response regulator [Bacteroidota bacterium]